MNKIIEVTGLKKAFGPVQAVDGIDFYVESGKLFSFLGPNGAGKSTTIDILCTFLKPDEGCVLMDGRRLGEEDDAIRGTIGAVFQDGLLDGLLTVEENLMIRGGLYGLKGRVLKEAVRAAAEAVGVTDLLKRPYGKLSGGQRRRCDVARALVHAPKILFLDEPTTGLDPQTRKSVWESIKMLQKQKAMTVFLTTHYMEEAASSDFVMVLDHGKIAAKGTPAQLRERYTSDRLTLVCADRPRVEALLRERGLAFTAVADQLFIPLSVTMDALPILEACKDAITGFEMIKGTMDDAFIAITGQEIRS